MSSIIIRGGIPLYGTVRISGSKNAALPVLFASLLTRGVSELYNIPDIGDVRVAILLLEGLGAEVERVGSLVRVDSRRLRYAPPDAALTASLRASTYLIGSSLIRFGKADVCRFGGCNFSPRPIDMHISAALAFGAEWEGERLVMKAPHPARIAFDKPSVGATVNALLMAAGISGESHLSGCAVEPHILTLADYLVSAGAEIVRDGNSFTVRGGPLRGGRAFIEGDMIEAGTYLTASLITGGRVRLIGVGAEEMRPFTEPLCRGGAVVQGDRGSITAVSPPREPVEIVAAPYPAFPTDLQPIVAPLLAAGQGGSITDTVFPDRFGYLSELSRVGLSYKRAGSITRIYPSEPTAAVTFAPDLRGGAALVLWALSCEGESRIETHGIIERGYEKIIEKLSAIGAEAELLAE